MITIEGENAEDASLLALAFRVSALMQETAERMQLVHLHLSVPISDGEEGTYHSDMLNSRANLTLQKMVEANKQDIHRKRMETALLAANIPGAAIRGLQDEAQTISYMSDGVTALFGYTKGEIERSFQNHYRMIIHPEDREKVALSIRNQREQGSMTEVQYRVITKERQMIWVLDKREYVYYGTGESFSMGYW